MIKFKVFSACDWEDLEMQAQKFLEAEAPTKISNIIFERELYSTIRRAFFYEIDREKTQ